jgi:hypothetical protein
MILDDYNDWLGCKKATDEFLSSHPYFEVERLHPHAILRKRALINLEGDNMTDADISKLVSALYKSILNRDPSPEYLRTHSATIRDAGVSDGVAGLVKHFLSTSEFRKRFDDPSC